MEDDPLPPIVRRAVDAAGGSQALADALGIRAPSIYGWRQVPAERVAAVARLTGIPAAELRPDLAALFPAQTAADAT